MGLLSVWKALPQAKQMQLAGQYGIKWFGTTDQQLEFELENKLPKGLLVVKEQPVEVSDEVLEETLVEVSEEVKEQPVKKTKKRK
jgi:hypothetical protein